MVNTAHGLIDRGNSSKHGSVTSLGRLRVLLQLSRTGMQRRSRSPRSRRANCWPHTHHSRASTHTSRVDVSKTVTGFPLHYVPPTLCYTHPMSRNLAHLATTRPPSQGIRVASSARSTLHRAQGPRPFAKGGYVCHALW